MSQRTFADLISIMARLRAPDGCPWDKEQTHESILSCLTEEAYEFVDAVEKKDLSNMKEELGDLLLQVVFHAQMASEYGAFDVQAVIEGICDKLVRRHPHVFGEGRLENADQVQTQWDELKKSEKSPTTDLGALGEMPRHLPALLKALKMQKRASKTGFDWPDWKGSSAKIAEELSEVEAEAEANDAEGVAREIGDLLFATVNLGRFFNVDPERALAASNARFISRFQTMEKLAAEKGTMLKGMALPEMDALWENAKALEKTE